jgi:hypothetical protein
MRILLLLAAVSSPLLAQPWSLYKLGSGAEQPVADVVDLGSVETGDELAVSFRLRNAGTAPAVPVGVAIAGAGFTLGGVIPANVSAGGFFDITVRFQPHSAGDFSAALEGPHGATIVRAKAVPGASIRAETGETLRSGSLLEWGAREIGGSYIRRIALENATTVPLMVQAAAAGAEFTLADSRPIELAAGQTRWLDLSFTPATPGVWLGALTVGGKRIGLRGEGVKPPLPNVSILADDVVRSGEQHVIRVVLDAPARTAARGEIVLQTGGEPQDSSILFANGGRTAVFDVKPGDQNFSFAYQTGATFGTLKFRLRLGERSSEATVHVPAEMIRIPGVTATREPAAVTVRVSALDNTRSTSLLTYTFFDREGREIGKWSRDYAESFLNHFRKSSLGGAYSVSMRFPVTGDVTLIDSVEVEMTNNLGLARTERIRVSSQP